MPEFLNLLPPLKALDLLFERLDPHPQMEEISSVDALQRVLAEPVIATMPLPSFARTTVDGYAVRARDTYGASESLPAYLALSGEVSMGAAPDLALQTAQCALIHTGGMLPDGADAVVMLENTQIARAGEVEILRAVAVGENVIAIGEDVRVGEQIIPAGVTLRPAEIGGLMALGITRIHVGRRPRVGILSSGDEVIPPEVVPKPGQVRDVNAYTLSALVQDAGGIPLRYGIIPDQADAMQSVARKALAECDVVVITAGSSASTRDLTAQVISELGEPGVLVHGVNVRPGKPTILSVCGGKAVIGLPGNPVSALVIASLFVTPVIRALQGERRSRPRASIPAILSVNLASQAGREDWIPVRLLESSQTGGASRYQADPVFGKSNLIFTLARADGYVRIDPDATGLSAGDSVEVILY
ncbi:MAG: molybdopterin-binding protein [Anaerolineales bacterium]